MFEKLGGLPGVIGAVDGTYIPIPRPVNDQQSYFNRKKFHSITLQAVCTSDYAFTDCYVGWPSSVHDARVLRNSALHGKVKTLFNPHYYLLGDPAYPVRHWLVVPYKENGRLTPSHKKFNNIVSKTRVKIEQAFGLLKGRFRRLKFLDIRDMKELNETVLMCCIFHNLSLCESDLESMMDTEPPDEEEEIDFVESREKAEGNHKRDWLRAYVDSYV
jgi:DDE superfamily endonuclease